MMSLCFENVLHVIDLAKATHLILLSILLIPFYPGFIRIIEYESFITFINSKKYIFISLSKHKHIHFFSFFFFLILIRYDFYNLHI
jgi:hypothetical protein